MAESKQQRATLKRLENISSTFVEELLVACSKTLQLFCQRKVDARNSLNKNHLMILKEQLGRLTIWGMGFEDDSLIRVLDHSVELLDHVLELLRNIGELLVKNFFLINSGDMEQYTLLKLMVLIYGSKPVTSNSADVKVESETRNATKSTVPDVHLAETKNIAESEIWPLSVAELRSSAISSDPVSKGGSIENSPHLESKTPDQCGEISSSCNSAFEINSNDANIKRTSPFQLWMNEQDTETYAVIDDFEDVDAEVEADDFCDLIRSHITCLMELIPTMEASCANLEHAESCNDGDTALLWASRNNHVQVVEVLLSQGADIEAKGNDNATSLVWASRNNNVQVVEKLLSQKANIEAKGNDNVTSLVWASRNGHGQIVEKLLSQGADIEAKGNDNKTSLIWASRNNHVQIVENLLNQGADIEAKGNNDWTALIWASRKGHRQIVEHLLSKGAKIETRGRHVDETSLQENNDDEIPLPEGGYDGISMQKGSDEETVSPLQKKLGWTNKPYTKSNYQLTEYLIPNRERLHISYNIPQRIIPTPTLYPSHISSYNSPEYRKPTTSSNMEPGLDVFQGIEEGEELGGMEERKIKK